MLFHVDLPGYLFSVYLFCFPLLPFPALFWIIRLFLELHFNLLAFSCTSLHSLYGWLWDYTSLTTHSQKSYCALHMSYKNFATLWIYLPHSCLPLCSNCRRYYIYLHCKPHKTVLFYLKQSYLIFNKRENNLLYFI